MSTGTPRNEASLGSYCKANDFDIFVVSFLYILQSGNPPLPGLNFANHCGSAPYAGYPDFLVCPDIEQDIKLCQSLGKTVVLSIGGATASGQFTTESQGKDYADVLWNTFLGGSSSKRPFGSAILDGIDFDIEGGSSIGFSGIVWQLRSHYASDASKNYYITGAPQVFYFF